MSWQAIPIGRRRWRSCTALPRAGADVIELGVPFSDPMAEGPPSSAPRSRALAGGMTLRACWRSPGRSGRGDATTPLVLMGYLNPLLAHGLARFAAEAAAAGIDGAIVVDCPPEEAGRCWRRARRQRIWR